MASECIKQDFHFIPKNIIPDPPITDLLPYKNRECCFELQVLASTVDTNELKNDKNGFLFWFKKDMVSTASIALEKNIDGVWTNQANLIDDTYGKFYAWLFFVNDLEEGFIGYQMHWRTVLAAFGEGEYRVKCSVTTVLSQSFSALSLTYCLHNYSAYRAEGTVKLEYNISGVNGFKEEDKERKDFGDLFWYNSFRLKGWFGFPADSYEQDYVQYNNGQRAYVIDEQEPEFILHLKNLPAYVHNLISVDVLRADQLLVTDYNSKNAEVWIQKSVQKPNEYKPDWKKMVNKMAPVTVRLRQEYNNLKKLRQ